MSEEKPKLQRPVGQILRRLLDFVLPYRRRVMGVVVLMFVTSLAVLLAPALVREAINQGLEGRDSGALAFFSFAFLGAMMMQAFGLRLQFFNMIWIGQHAIMDVRRQVFYKYLELNLSYYDHNRVGDLMARVTEDSNSLQNFITWAVISTISNTFTLLGIIIVMLVYDWQLALMTFTILPAMIGLTWWWRKQSSVRYRAVREAVGVVSASLQENLAGMRIIQAFVREYREKARFGDVATTELKASLRADQLASIYMPGIDLISQIGVAIVLGFGGLRVLEGDMDAGTLVAFLLYLELFFNPIRDIAMRLDQFQEASAAGERILNVLDASPTINDAHGAYELPKLQGAVEMRHVNFFYEKPPDIQPPSAGGSSVPAVISDDSAVMEADESEEKEASGPKQVLFDVSMKAEPGQTIALVGHTGAGKSTIVRLLGRFYEAKDGQVLFDDHDINRVTIDSLRRQIAWVPQDTGLFATTIMENLRYGRLDASEDEIIAAAKETGAHEFIAAMPKGYETDVEEGGSRLSAGQRQLISFTRALLADPAVIVLDEATSSVDTITELQMQAALARLLENRTAFVIAHRLSTIVKADQVVMLDHGRIIEQGTHHELLAQGGHYYDLYTTQLQGSDAAD